MHFKHWFIAEANANDNAGILREFCCWKEAGSMQNIEKMRSSSYVVPVGDELWVHCLSRKIKGTVGSERGSTSTSADQGLGSCLLQEWDILCDF